MHTITIRRLKSSKEKVIIHILIVTDRRSQPVRRLIKQRLYQPVGRLIEQRVNQLVRRLVKGPNKLDHTYSLNC